MTTLGLATSSLRHRKLRTALTVLSVVVASVLLTVSLSSVQVIGNLTKFAKDQPRIITSSLVSGEMLPFSYVEKIRKQPDLESVYWFRQISADDGGPFRFIVWAASDNYPVQAPDTLFNTDPQTNERWLADRQGMLVSPSVMARFGWTEGQQVTFHTALGNVQGKVSGLARGYYATNSIVVMHYEYLEELVKREQRYRVNVIVGRGKNLESVGQAIDAEFERSSDPTLTIPLDQYLASALQRTTAIPQLLFRVSLLMLLVTFMTTASTISMSLRERRAEFGILRALGFSQGRVLGMIFLESVTVCLIGGLIGAGVPYLLFHEHGITLGGNLSQSFALKNVVISSTTCLTGIVCSALLGILCSLLPAITVIRQEVIQTLSDR